MDAGVMRNRLIKYFIIILCCTSCAKVPVYIDYDNMDYGLPKTPDKKEYFDITEDKEQGTVYGISNIDTFYIDINDDGKKDKITRGQFVTMTAHGYTFYKMELNNGKELNMPDFRTFEGADCFLQAYKFQFNPFILTKVSRSLGEESWVQPMPAKIETFKIIDDKLEKVSEKSVDKICDVRELLVK